MLTFDNAHTNIVFDGNSLFANQVDVNGVYSNDYRIGEILMTKAPISGRMTYKNLARGGATFKSMISGTNGQSGIAEVTAAFEVGKQNALFFIEGVNTALTPRPDGSAATAADLIQDCKDYIAAAKNPSTGNPAWRMYAVLAFPYKDDASPSAGNAAIDGYNAYIRENYAAMGLEGYVETRRPGGVLPYQAPYTYPYINQSGYYKDDVHLNYNGNVVVAQYIADMLPTIPDTAPAAPEPAPTPTATPGGILLCNGKALIIGGKLLRVN
jgi:hypothetical protein